MKLLPAKLFHWPRWLVRSLRALLILLLLLLIALSYLQPGLILSWETLAALCGL